MTETAVAPGIDRRKLAELKEREDAAFIDSHAGSIERWNQAKAVMPNGVPMSWLRTSYDHPPLFVESGAGRAFRDVDGHEYADFNIADMSMFTGYGPAPVVEAVSRQVAPGSQYLLPTEDSIWVAGELARRYGLPLWQFTLSATSANTEVDPDRPVLDRPREGAVLRRQVPRPLRRRPGRARGRPPGAGGGRACRTTSRARTLVVPFNDLDALERALAAREVAVVITEPALTNNVGLLMPDDGFHDGSARSPATTGTLLAYDETHTQVVGPGGLTRMWGLAPDFVTVGQVDRRAASRWVRTG